MELDSTIVNGLYFDEVTFDEVTENNLIKCYTKFTSTYNTIYFYSDGSYLNHTASKCVIFPKGKTTWEGFVPPCKFKDGDVISDALATCIFKREGRIKGTVDYYCGIHDDDFCVKDNKRNQDGHYGCIVDYRLATEEEKQKLFDAIKENGYRWNPETKTLEKLVEPKFKVGDEIRIKGTFSIYVVAEIREDCYMLDDKDISLLFKNQDEWELVPNKFDITTLKPFDKVLVRDGAGLWRPSLFGNDMIAGYRYFTSNGSYKECIPYEGNEHLLGKTDDCDEFYKTWE
jgi:hypothetical protein